MSMEKTVPTRRSRRVRIMFAAAGLLTFTIWQSGLAQTSTADSQATGDEPHSVIVTPEESDYIWVFAKSKDSLGPGGAFHIYLDSETHPEAKAAFAKFALGVGGALPEHKHDRTEEISYFLSGEGTVKVYEHGEPKEVPVRAGYVWYNPAGVWHAVTNTGDEPLKLVFVTIPNEKKDLLSFFRTIGVKPGEEATPLSQDEFARIAAEHDLILKPPTTIE